MKYFLLSLFSVFTFSLKSQVTVFKTYEGYKKGLGVFLDGYKYYGVNEKGGISLVFSKESTADDFDTYNINCMDFWGFKYGDNMLFVNDTATGIPFRVMSKGRLIYYENGTRHLIKLDHPHYIDLTIRGYSYALSKSLSTRIFPIVWKGDKYLEFFEKYPEYGDLEPLLYRENKRSEPHGKEMQDIIRDFEGSDYLEHLNVKIYKTYEDYLEDKGDEYVELVEYRTRGYGFEYYFLKQDGTKEIIFHEDMWGYKENEELYRMGSRWGRSLRVSDYNAPISYVNICFESSLGIWKNFISESLTSPTIEVKAGSKFKNTILKYEGGDEFLDCFGRNYQSIADFEDCLYELRDLNSQ